MTHSPFIAHLFGQEAQDILMALVPAIGGCLLLAVMSWFWNPGRPQ